MSDQPRLLGVVAVHAADQGRHVARARRCCCSTVWCTWACWIVVQYRGVPLRQLSSAPQPPGVIRAGVARRGRRPAPRPRGWSSLGRRRRVEERAVGVEQHHGAGRAGARRPPGPGCRRSRRPTPGRCRRLPLPSADPGSGRSCSSGTRCQGCHSRSARARMSMRGVALRPLQVKATIVYVEVASRPDCQRRVETSSSRLANGRLRARTSEPPSAESSRVGSPASSSSCSATRETAPRAPTATAPPTAALSRGRRPVGSMFTPALSVTPDPSVAETRQEAQAVRLGESAGVGCTVD